MVKTFASKKFHSLITANTVAMLTAFLVLFSDNIIAGNMVGESALSAITLISPFFSLLVSAGVLVSVGTTIIVSYEVGKGDRESANRYFSQGVILAAGMSVLLTAVLLGTTWWLPVIFGASGESGGYVAEYYYYMRFLPAPLLFNALLYDLLLNEGGERYALVSTGVQFFANIGLSILLCSKMGIGGISLASVIGYGLGTLILSLFFFSGRCAFRFRWYASLRAVARMAQYSVVDVGIHFYSFLLSLCMNLFLLHRFGDDGIVVFTMVVNIMMLMLAGFDGLAESIQPLISVYRAEGNQTGIRKTMECASRMATVEGVAMTLLLLAAADHVPGLFGVTTPRLVVECALAIRIFSLSACAASFFALYLGYFVYMGKILYIAFASMLYFFALPVPLGVGLGLLFGLRGVWAAFAAANVISLLICLLGAKRRYGSAGRFPLLDPERLREELSYDVPKTPESIDSLVARVERDLTERGVPRDKILKIMMMIDSTEMYSMEMGEEKGVVVECTILLRDAVTLILRDSGDRDAVMDERAIAAPEAEGDDTSLNFVCRTVLGGHRNRQHILTGGKNRSIFHF